MKIEPEVLIPVASADSCRLCLNLNQRVGVSTEPLEWEWDIIGIQWFAISPKWDYTIGIEDFVTNDIEQELIEIEQEFLTRWFRDGVNVAYARRRLLKWWRSGKKVVYAHRRFAIYELIGIGSLHDCFDTVGAAKAAAEQWHAERYLDEQEEYDKATREDPDEEEN